MPRPAMWLLHAGHHDDIVRQFLEEKPAARLTDEGIRDGLSGNLCRCTGYQNIVAAVRTAAELMRG